MIGDYTESMNRAAAGTSAALRAGGIGDVTSSERGTGARFNAGKPPMELMPLRLIGRAFVQRIPKNYEANPPTKALIAAGDFQESGRIEPLLQFIEAHAYALPDCARVLDFGRQKYATHNWMKGMPWSIPLACIARHALRMIDGEADDAESGLPHIGHVLANFVFLAHYVDYFPEGNDLPPPELFK